MKSTQASKPESITDLKKAAALATNIAAELKALWADLGKPSTINRYQETNFLKLQDEINNINSELASRIDGRPQPLDFSGRYIPSEETLAEYPQQAIVHFEESAAEAREWAVCYERGPGELARVGEMQFTLADLRAVQDWISEVIAWHESEESKHKAK